MKQNLKIAAYFIILCFCMIGCNNEVQNIATSSVMTDLPAETVSSAMDDPIDKGEYTLFKDVDFNKNNKLKVSEYFSNLYQSTDKNFSMEDKTFEQDGYKGKSDIHYPYFKGEKEKYEVLNSIILVSVFDACDYNSHDAVIDRTVDYEIKTATDRYVSILFSGHTDNYESTRTYNISFAINFDLEHNARVSIDDVMGTDARTVKGDELLLQQLHSAMKEQFDEEITDAFEAYTTEDICSQFYQSDRGYYVLNDKIYIQFRLSTGSYYSDFIYFDIQR